MAICYGNSQKLIECEIQIFWFFKRVDAGAKQGSWLKVVGGIPFSVPNMWGVYRVQDVYKIVSIWGFQHAQKRAWRISVEGTNSSTMQCKADFRYEQAAQSSPVGTGLLPSYWLGRVSGYPNPQAPTRILRAAEKGMGLRKGWHLGNKRVGIEDKWNKNKLHQLTFTK